MALYAHIENGIVFDPVIAADATEAKALFVPLSDAWVFTSIPDGTQQGATDNGDGTYTNPVGATATPVTLAKVAFMDLAYPFLGVDLAGVARYGEILTQAKASVSPLVVASMERYTHASVFERDDVATFLDILVADAGVDVTQAERDAIVNGWPENGAA